MTKDYSNCVFLDKYPGYAICPNGEVFRIHNSREIFRECNNVHQMIAEAFVPNPKGKKEVTHIDGDKGNNHPSNLRWGKERPDYHSKLTVDNVETIYTLFAKGLDNGSIAKRFGVSKSTISMIRSGLSWRHLYEEFYGDGQKPMSGRVRRDGELTDSQVKEIYALLSDKKRNIDIAKNFGVTPNTISCIKNGRHYKHLYHLYSEGSKTS